MSNRDFEVIGEERIERFSIPIFSKLDAFPSYAKPMIYADLTSSFSPLKVTSTLKLTFPGAKTRGNKFRLKQKFPTGTDRR